nr:uncharacterized protein LOC109150699 isoform X4 [Ipomoea batatas]GME15515.1 uncharacterized protein LOC109150699 isoform X4 [Ipomoea batatas]
MEIRMKIFRPRLVILWDRTAKTHHVPYEWVATIIKTRGMPQELVLVVTDLNQRQRQDVCDIGMGGLLRLRVNEILLRLGYWLVSNFDPSQMRLKLANVASSSSHRRMWQLYWDYQMDWCQFQSAIASVIVVSSLVASVSNGYVNEQIVHMFRDVNKIKDLDWCGYLLCSLVATHKCWIYYKTRKFTRPLLFLTASRGGTGHTEINTRVGRVDNEVDKNTGGKGVGDSHPQHAPGLSTVQPAQGRPAHTGFVRDFSNATTELLSPVTMVVDMVHQQCELAHEDPNFMRLAKATNLINGVTQTGMNDPIRNAVVDPQSSIPRYHPHSANSGHSTTLITVVSSAKERQSRSQREAPLMQDPRPFYMYFSSTMGNEVLFSHNTQIAKWVDFLTLREGSGFAPLMVDVGIVVDISANRNDRVKWFEKRLDKDLQTTNHVGTTTLDMGPYYVMSINFEQYRLDILHNSSKRMSNGDKYLDAPV